MSRDTREVRSRLQNTALELFRDHGYDQTTAAEIAARAGVTERTFFRYFADKREVLFAGAEKLRLALVEGIADAPDIKNPLQAVVEVLTSFDWESLETRDFQRQRYAVIASNPELLERELTKRRSMAIAFTDALQQRGVDANIAQLAAQVGTQIFSTVYEQWLIADNKTDLSAISETVMSHLTTIMSSNPIIAAL
jgi:AcrR family transcriptional regulator